MGIEREWTLISVHIMFPCQLLSNPIPRIVWEQDSPLQYTKHCIRLPILLLLLLFLLQEAGLTISPNPISIPLPPLLLPEPQSSAYPSPSSYCQSHNHQHTPPPSYCQSHNHQHTPPPPPTTARGLTMSSYASLTAVTVNTKSRGMRVE